MDEASLSGESTSMEDDLFFDLFGENGILTTSPGSTISTLSGTDSGIGSPFDSNIDDASPLQFPHDDGELWDAILDDLPNDIDSDSSSGSLVQMNDPGDNNTMSWLTNDVTNGFIDFHQLSNKPTTWSNQPISLPAEVAPQISTIPMFDMPSPEFTVDADVENTKKTLSSIINNMLTAESIKSASDKNIVYISQNASLQSEIEENSSNSIDSMFNILGKVSTSDEGETTATHISKDHDYAEKSQPISSQTQSTFGVSQGIGPGIVLTDEEKKLLRMESATLPENMPLTKDEEKVLKRVRRKIKNKQSAMESRRRRKDYIHNLEHRVKHCTDTNNKLNEKVEKLSKENKHLQAELKVMKEYCKSIQQTKAINPGTCLAVLVLSFALFVLPFNPLHYFGGKSGDVAANDSPTTFRSRTLLAIDDTDYTYQDKESLISKSSHLLSPYADELQSKSLQIHHDEMGSYSLKFDYYVNKNFTVSNSTNDGHFIAF